MALAVLSGVSCEQIRLGDQSSNRRSLRSQMPKYFSSKDRLEVGDMQQFRATFEPVDTTNGTGKVRIEGSDDVLSLKLSDPRPRFRHIS